MRQTKKRLLLSQVVVAAMLFAACGSDDDGESASTEPAAEDTGGDAEAPAEDGGADAPALSGSLRVLVHQNPPMVAFMEDFNDQFEADTGVSVDMTVVNASDLTTVNQTRMTAGDIDVTTISLSAFDRPVQPYMTGVTPQAWQTLIEGGNLMDLTDQPFVANYDPTAIADGGTFDGKVYGLPLGRVTYSGMFVNLDLLADVGVETPTTWTELVAACDAVKGAGNTCMTVGGQDGWPIFVGTYGLLGALFPDQQALTQGLWEGTLAWNDEQGLELFNRYETYAKDMLDPGNTGLAPDAAPARFSAGDIAFLPGGAWMAPALEDAGAPFEWTYVPFPGSDNAADNQFLFGKYDQTWAVAAGTPNPDAAMAYLEAFSEPEAYNAFVNAVGFLPTQPTATLDSTLGNAVADLLPNYRVGFEQWFIAPGGAGQWANGSQGAQWFVNGNFDDAQSAADAADADLKAGL